MAFPPRHIVPRAVENSVEQALYDAAKCGLTDEVRRILTDHPGLSLEIVSPGNSSTPLLLAAWRRNEAVLGMLLDAGASVQSRGFHGKTALHIAVEGSLDTGADDQKTIIRLVQRLLDDGADVHAQDENGHTPFFYAIENVVPDVHGFPLLELLWSSGGDINHQDRAGWTMLHGVAYEMGHQLELAQWLVQKGASLDLQDDEGRRPGERSDNTVGQWLNDERRRREQNLLHQVGKGQEPLPVPVRRL